MNGKEYSLFWGGGGIQTSSSRSLYLSPPYYRMCEGRPVISGPLVPTTPALPQ